MNTHEAESSHILVKQGLTVFFRDHDRTYVYTYVCMYVYVYAFYLNNFFCYISIIMHVKYYNEVLNHGAVFLN